MQSIILHSDQQITENGIYDIPIERYHHDPDLCDGPSISSTGLRLVLDCPAKYWDTSPYNPDRTEREEKHHFTIGKMAHSIALEDKLPDGVELFPFKDMNSNEGHKGEFEGAKSYLAYKKMFVKIKADEGIQLVKQEDIDTAYAMSDALKSNPLVEAGALSGMTEQSLIWRDEKTGIWLRTRPDTLPLDGSAISDYKTTTDAAAHKVARAISQYKYYMQFALMGEGVRKVMGHVVENYMVISQEKTPPYVSSCHELSDEYIACGMVLNRQAIDLFASCMESGKWPGYPDDDTVLNVPEWIKRRAFGDNSIDLSILDNGVS